MSLQYIRDAYGVPAYRGAVVVFDLGGVSYLGRITSGSHHLRVRPNRKPSRRLIFHPLDVEYASEWEPKT